MQFSKRLEDGKGAILGAVGNLMRKLDRKDRNRQLDGEVLKLEFSKMQSRIDFHLPPRILTKKDVKVKIKENNLN